ncbi:hypothetical protein [Luteibacter sp. UNCMF331Sha3.1]|uniref:hypothetical protein n=1 Tax=Luteibacter sp. UNCMF331Sha3.1 TaxID=1502760 RepID=UPI000B7DBB61|nr:hypothetical protein [Luteibacter sp. UNCMF331Sha3.1]
MEDQPSSCDMLGTPVNALQSYTASMTHPSGLAASFTVHPTRRGRSAVSRVCRAAPGAPSNPTAAGTYAYTPNAYYSMAITQKQFSGAGIGTQTWQYSYSPSNESWSVNCAGGCVNTVWTKVVYPDGHAERSSFSNRYDYSESLLLSEEVFEGEVDVSRRRQLTEYGYVSPVAGADARNSKYPSPWGTTPGSRMNDAQIQNHIPMGSRVVTIDDDPNPADPRGDDQFVWNVLEFDGFARPYDVQRYNNFGYGVRERTDFLDDNARWVLGMPLQSTNVTTDEVVSRNVYDGNSMLAERYRFGRKVMGYSFDAAGQLASFTDGNGKTTFLGNYKRGIPQSINYPDSRTQSIGVDDLGQIASITNQAGATTSYGYDPIGRLAGIDYPGGDSVAWAPRIFQYSFVGAARGVNGAHWVRTVTQGNKFQRTDFDAMLRPVMSGTARASDQAFYVSARTDFDWNGRKTFASYPVDGYVDLQNIGAGVGTTYDVLGRVVRTVQASELGNLTTTTDYLSGGAKRVTDPKGNPTTSWFQTFDQASFDHVVKVIAPEGVVQTISRDIFGKPTEITQGGGGTSLTKTMKYDGEHRLCRTWEPESGSEIMAYDGADNLAWSVSGASFNGAGCGQDQVAEAAKTSRGYDAMNRVTSVVYPTGTQPSTFTYDPLGNPATATSGLVSWTFGRNKLGLMTAEVLAVDGWSWALGYGYDPNGALSTVLYPDGEIVSYNPDALGRPTTAGAYAGGVGYFPDGDVKSFGLGNGTLYSAEKNPRNLLKSFTYARNTVRVVSEGFAYDANGNVSGICDDFVYDANGNVDSTCGLTGHGQRSKTMTYDGLNRLLSATAINLWGTESYTYDTLNNIRSLTSGGVTNNYGYDGSNLLRSISVAANPIHTFDYDARGNTINKDGQQLNFDMANRLTSIPTKGEYTYDAAGRRVKKVAAGATTYYAYNSAGQLMWEYDAATTNGTNYVYLGKKLVANVKGPTSKIMGVFDGVTFDGNTAYLGGWVCSSGLDRSVDVHVYVGDVGAAATFVQAATANLASEPALRTLCHANGNAYRFRIPLSEEVRTARVDQAISIYGISPVGNNNNALDNSGNVFLPAATAAPSSPASVSATAPGDQSTISVTWAASTNVSSYAVERSYNGQPWVTLWTGAATSAAFGGAVDGAYVFRVRACNAQACAARVKSNTVTVAHIPPAPPGLTVPGTSSGSVGISWGAASWATSYQVEHTYDGNWSQIYNGTSTSFTMNEAITAGWYYRVRGCNVNGCGPYSTSAGVSVTIPPQVAPPIFGGGANHSGSYTISWNGVAGATVYNLVESANGGGWQQVAYGSGGAWSTGGRPNGTYAYMVQACNAGGCSSWSAQAVVVVTLPPTTPGMPSVTQSGPSNKPVVRVAWTAQTYATRYEVMETLPSGYSEIIQGTTGTFITFVRFFTGSLSYKVRACNDVGCSPWGPSRSIGLVSGG